MAGLQQAAQKLGLKAEGVQVSREALPDISPPAIVWLHRDHYAVLTGIWGRGDEAHCTIRDPNQPGEENWLQEKLLQQSSGVLLLLHR
ncbi:MAG: Peptidase family [Chthonomonadaceae bacterium]|nr:Peptidase family [Chthonomonadaceae bacterium]